MDPVGGGSELVGYAFAPFSHLAQMVENSYFRGHGASSVANVSCAEKFFLILITRFHLGSNHYFIKLNT